jgi:hypothetical protein
LKLLYNGHDTLQPSNNDVFVEVVLVDVNQEPDGIFVVNTEGNANGYIFKENGTFTFQVMDKAGNMSQITAVVDTIDRTPPSYTISYSETGPTKNNVTATIVVAEADADFIIVNEDIAREPITVTGRIITIEFDDNGYYPLTISDPAGNKRTVLCQVYNIDRTKPTLSFKHDYVVTSLAREPELDDFYAFDRSDGEITSQVTYSTLDVSTPGLKQVIYEVSDRAGNTTTVTRDILVVGDAFTVVIDGEIRTQPFTVNKGWLNLNIFNFIEKYQAKYHRQHKSQQVMLSDFKTGGLLFKEVIDTTMEGIDELLFTVDRPGWYRIYIQDQNRQTFELLIFFSNTTSRGE